MNDELKTTEYLKKLESIRLSDSSRARMQKSLLEYARFHGVREGAESRSNDRVPVSTWLSVLNRMSSMPLTLLVTVVLGAGTSFAAQSAVPGDFLYPIKTEINETVRGAFAFGTQAKVAFETALLEERVEEAETLQTRGALTQENTTHVAETVEVHADRVAVLMNSDTDAALDAEVRVGNALARFANISNPDTGIAADSSVSVTTMLAKGVIAIDVYLSDMKLRVNTLRGVIEKHEADLSSEVEAEFTTKLDKAAVRVADAGARLEADARVLLDEAAILIGEVEAKLSTLGQVEIDVNTGMITDVDFSIDPMQIGIHAPSYDSENGDTETTESVYSDPASSGFGGGVDIGVDIDVDAAIETDSTNTVIEGGVGIEATSGLAH